MAGHRAGDCPSGFMTDLNARYIPFEMDRSITTRWNLQDHESMSADGDVRRINHLFDKETLNESNSLPVKDGAYSDCEVQNRREVEAFLNHLRDLVELLPGLFLAGLPVDDKGIPVKKTKLYSHYYNDPYVSRERVLWLLNLCLNSVYKDDKLKPVVHLQSPCAVFGDTHSNLNTLLMLEKMLFGSGPCTQQPHLLFLGDYVDRNQMGVELVCFLLCLKYLCPSKITMIRGNHEERSICKHSHHKPPLYGFLNTLNKRFNDSTEEGNSLLFKTFFKIFDRLPICAVIDEKIFCCHGGPPKPEADEEFYPLSRLEQIKLPVKSADNRTVYQMTWNDPVNSFEEDIQIREALEYARNKFTWDFNIDDRCVRTDVPGYSFNIHRIDILETPPSQWRRDFIFCYNEIALDKFLQGNGFTHVFRGHSVKDIGYQLFFGGRLVSLHTSCHYHEDEHRPGVVLYEDDKIRLVSLTPDHGSMVNTKLKKAICMFPLNMKLRSLIPPRKTYYDE